MPSKDRRQHRIPKSAKLPKVRTIEDLLARDDVNGILSDLDKVKPNISDLIVIYMDKETKKYSFQITGETLESTVVWMLENVKLDILNNEEE